MRRTGKDGRAGERDAQFAAFMSGNAHRLYRVAYLLTYDAGQAEELTQHAMVRTYTAWDRIVDGDGYGYARRVLINLHSDWWRRWLRRERPTPKVPDQHSPGADPADAAVTRTSLARALQQLSQRERAVVVCRYYLDLTEQQTADELGVALGTVKSAGARALRKLRVDPRLTPLTETQGAS